MGMSVGGSSCLIATILIIFIVSAACKPPSKAASVAEGVVEKGLVKDNLNYRSVIKNHDMEIAKDRKNFEPASLGFVTPWNSRGYVVAETLGCKFTYISPVWYQIQPDIALRGGHDVDLVIKIAIIFKQFF